MITKGTQRFRARGYDACTILHYHNISCVLQKVLQRSFLYDSMLYNVALGAHAFPAGLLLLSYSMFFSQLRRIWVISRLTSSSSLGGVWIERISLTFSFACLIREPPVEERIAGSFLSQISFWKCSKVCSRPKKFPPGPTLLMASNPRVSSSTLNRRR